MDTCGPTVATTPKSVHGGDSGAMLERVQPPPDPGKAVYFFKRACYEGELADACHRLNNEIS